ncbi:MAG: hypothetical protein EA417_22020 [Gammaproteobacteria bacterium]|nr:MAG: hypothetical protein EA417_22020 [Gammaproteobacteria bacterium]
MGTNTLQLSTLRQIPGLLLAAALIAATACSPDHHPDGETNARGASHAHDHGGGMDIPAHVLGSIDFRAACSTEAAATFNDGLGYLHHMMYEQARSTFERIAEQHPECAMGHWGVATTLFQPLWPTRPSVDTLRQGQAAIERARQAGTGDDREQQLIDATAAFFSEPEEADWWTRIRRWADGMEAAHVAHPEDADTATLYALSRLALAFVEEDARAGLHEEAATVLLRVHDYMPEHPGAMHYLIHANDVDGRAHRSLEVIEGYSDIAPEVPHALHMPSHLYVRLGKWPETIEWNARSADAALNFPVGDTISFHYLHAIDYKIYAYLQKGEDAKANAIAETALAKGTHQPSFNSAFHLAAIPARLAIERRDWEKASELEPRTPENQPWDSAMWPEGMVWFARGMGAVEQGDLEHAREADRRLEALKAAARADGEESFARYIEVDRLILAGWRAHAAGYDDNAVGHLEAAVDLDRTVEKHPITPGALYPPGEALGDLLLRLGRYEDALAAFEASADRWPGRFHTVAGAARAADAAGDEALAARYYDQLLELVGDSDRPAVTEASRFVAAR